MMTTRPAVTRTDKTPVIETCATGFSLPKKSVKSHCQACPQKQDQPYDIRHEAGRKVQPDPTGCGHVVDLPEHLGHVGRVPGGRPIERHGGRVQKVERLGGLMTIRFARHRRPILVDHGPEVADDSLLQGQRLRLRAIGIAKEGRRGARFVGDGILGLAEFVPHRDHCEGEEDCIDDPDRRELESGDFVVLDQFLRADRFSDEELRGHRGCGWKDHDQCHREPQRQARQENDTPVSIFKRTCEMIAARSLSA